MLSHGILLRVIFGEGKVVEQFAVNEAIATADALEQTTFNAVVEKTGVVPRNFAILGKNKIILIFLALNQ